MRILIAEGSPVIADRLTRTMNELPGIESVTHASNVAGVMCSIEEQRPDVVIVDTHIAGSGAIELLEEIKRRRPAAVLIVLSNEVGGAHRRRCLRAGTDYFLDISNEFDRVPELVLSIQKVV